MVVAVQPGALRPDLVADSNPPSVMSCELPPLELIVRATGVVSVSPPPVPVTVTVAVPSVAELDAVSVSTALPAPVILDGLKAAVRPKGNPLADKLMALLNPPETVLETVVVPALPCATVRAAGFAVSVKLGFPPPEVTVRVIATVSVIPAPVPVMVMEVVPATAVLPAVRVSVELPAPPVKLEGLNAAVTPVGRPLALKETVLSKPPETLLVITELTAFPAATLTVEGFALSVKLGLPPPVTVRLTSVASLRLPLVPAIVIGYVPAAAEPDTVNVSVELPLPPEIVDGLKAAVTPDGRPAVVRATELLKELNGAHVMVDVPVCPAGTVNALGLGESVKLAGLPDHGVPPRKSLMSVVFSEVRIGALLKIKPNSRFSVREALEKFSEPRNTDAVE